MSKNLIDGIRCLPTELYSDDTQFCEWKECVIATNPNTPVYFYRDGEWYPMHFLDTMEGE